MGIWRPLPNARGRTRRMGGAWRRLYSLRATIMRTRCTRARPASSVCSCATKACAAASSGGDRLSPSEHAAAQAFVDQLQQQGDGRALVQRVHAMVARAEYKRRQAPPILRVRARAFGSGRQMPIAARYA